MSKNTIIKSHLKFLSAPSFLPAFLFVSLCVVIATFVTSFLFSIVVRDSIALRDHFSISAIAVETESTNSANLETKTIESKESKSLQDSQVSEESQTSQSLQESQYEKIAKTDCQAYALRAGRQAVNIDLAKPKTLTALYNTRDILFASRQRLDELQVDTDLLVSRTASFSAMIADFESQVNGLIAQSGYLQTINCSDQLQDFQENYEKFDRGVSDLHQFLSDIKEYLDQELMGFFRQILKNDAGNIDVENTDADGALSSSGEDASATASAQSDSDE